MEDCKTSNLVYPVSFSYSAVNTPNMMKEKMTFQEAKNLMVNKMNVRCYTPTLKDVRSPGLSPINVEEGAVKNNPELQQQQQSPMNVNGEADAAINNSGLSPIKMNDEKDAAKSKPKELKKHEFAKPIPIDSVKKRSSTNKQTSPNENGQPNEKSATPVHTLEKTASSSSLNLSTKSDADFSELGKSQYRTC